MRSKIFKKGMALLLALLMIFCALPAVSFAEEVQYPVMMRYTSTSSSDYHAAAYCTKVYSVTFLDKIDSADINSADTLAFWDVSEAGDGSVMAWIKKNEAESTAAGADRYDVFIGGEGGVGANPDSSWIFYCFTSLEKVNGLENFKTGTATTFYKTFSLCSSLEEIDLSSWNTSNVTNMNGVFQNCRKLKNVNVHGWNTSNVTDMSYMFYNCELLTEVDLRTFDTSKVTTMYFMFYRAGKLTNIYIGSDWSNESISDPFESVFNCCYALRGGKEEYDKAPQDAAIYAVPKPEGNLELYFKVEYKFEGDVPAGITAPEKVFYEKNAGAFVEAAPEVPDGYVFSGWSTDDAVVTGGEFTVSNDVLFVGEWSKVYKVNYVYTGEVPENAPAVPETKTYKAGETVDLEGIPAVDGYAFVGWTNRELVLSGGNFIMPAEDVTLYGYFKKPVSGVVINTGDIVLNIEDEEQLDITVNPEDATIKDIVYESSDETVVKVDENGKITTVGEGEATITVTSKDDPTKKDTITVTVKIPVEDIVIENTDTELNVGEETQLDITINPDNATDNSVTFESSDETVVKVDENGKITAVGEGEATITVTSKDDPTKKDTITVTVKIPVEDIVIENTDTELNVGEETQLDITVNPDNATDNSVTFESSDETVVKVDEKGKITAVGEGEATITVTSKDDPTKKDTITVTVKIPVEDIVIENTDTELNVGEETQLDITVNPEDATIKDIVYESSDETVVKVDENGKITAVGEGEATITVTSKDDPTKKDTITVTVKVPVEDIVIENTDTELNVGEETQLDITVNPDNATDNRVTFESSDETVVKVDENGKITAVGEGEATITVTSKDDPTKKDTITVTVKIPVEDIVIENTDTELNVGEETQLDITVNPDNATDNSVTFESSDETVVKVDENGKITAVGEGEATITVTSKDDPTKKDTITVTVKVPVEEPEDDSVTSITAPEKITVILGEEKEITASVNENAGNKGLIYESANEEIVKVDANGMLTGVKEGSTTVKVLSAENPDIFVEITVTVTTKPASKLKHYMVFGKTDKIGWYSVSLDNGKTYRTVFGNSHLEVQHGTTVIIKANDMMGDAFTFYINGEAVKPDENGCVYVLVDKYILVGALGIPVEAPDFVESLNLIQQIIKLIKDFFMMIANLFKK